MDLSKCCRLLEKDIIVSEEGVTLFVAKFQKGEGFCGILFIICLSLIKVLRV